VTPRPAKFWIYAIGCTAIAVGLVVFDAPSWLALGAGLAIALTTGIERPKEGKLLTTLSLQLGVIALGAGMNLDTVLRVGVNGALVTATGLAITVTLGLSLGRWLGVEKDTSLLVAVGTGICGGSAIAAVSSVIRPKDHETSIALAVVFVLNAIALVLFPMIGHLAGMSETLFGRWAALAIHDTSSVVGAGLAYGSIALTVATTTKLARALWIVPVTLATAVMRPTPSESGSLKDVKWPWFILGFLAVAALVTWVPSLAVYGPPVALAGKRSLLVALFLIGLSLSPKALVKVGPRPFFLGVILWVVLATVSIPLAIWST
jgi:uncharacterized integral membrane protein (TIGR00698 family)